ncbi:MAG: DUF3781 domain-containing protein [Lachnospiraceae bacterium]|nr:DUF3781 domain-containing protein [Lachnospiraceae bacterium]
MEQLHTTELGAQRIRNNLHLDVDDVIDWCKTVICSPTSKIIRKGKNWYITMDGCTLTVNATSYTVITAHSNT